MPPTITRKNWRGTYVARLTVNDRGTFDRDWAEISRVAKGNGPSIRYYSDLAPGWYESREGYRMHKGQPTAKQYHRVTDTDVSPIDFETLAAAVAGPLPGRDGEWGSGLYECGEDVSTFDGDGYPKCSAHTVLAGVSDLPVPA